MLKPEQLDDEAVMALLDEHAVELGGRLAVERIDGRWRAGFVVPDDVGESIALPAEGLHPSAARRELLIRAAEALDMSARLAIRTAEALEMSANVADHEAARLELAGRSDDAAREVTPQIALVRLHSVLDRTARNRPNQAGPSGAPLGGPDTSPERSPLAGVATAGVVLVGAGRSL